MNTLEPQTTLLIGAEGMLGRAFGQRLTETGAPFTSLTRTQLDLADSARIREAIGSGTSLVINCAAFTNVDAAESRLSEAMRINASAVGELAARCAEVGATLVHFSSDYVFAGQAHQPYRVDSPRQPINAYGRSKLAGEQLLEGSGCAYLLIRTSWLYAGWGTNFVLTMLRLMKHERSIRVVQDQVGRPSSALNVASSALALVARGARGTYHVCDEGQVSWFEFACAIATLTHSNCCIVPCSSREYERPAVRPAYSVLDLSKTEALLGALPDFRASLRATLQQIGVLALLLNLLVLATGCGAEPEPTSSGNSGVAPERPLGSLDEDEVDAVCRWSVQRSGSVECSDGSMASHSAVDDESCARDWAFASCSARVADLEACLASDPCDAEAVARTCAAVAACSDTEGEFVCADGLSSVDRSGVCDGNVDCSDSSDEDGCGEL